MQNATRNNERAATGSGTKECRVAGDAPASRAHAARLPIGGQREVDRVGESA
jgi:hypothetical protein